MPLSQVNTNPAPGMGPATFWGCKRPRRVVGGWTLIAQGRNVFGALLAAPMDRGAAFGFSRLGEPSREGTELYDHVHVFQECYCAPQCFGMLLTR
jgi:hypothetical protein